jgi:Ca-activated chloride channel family protein
MSYDGFILVLKSVNVGSVARGGTSMLNLIREAARSFKSTLSSNKILIIISDGEDTEGEMQKSIEAAKRAGIRVFCVGIGTEKGSPIQYSDGKGNSMPIRDEKGKAVISRLEEGNLKRIAAATGGYYERSTGSRSGLDIIYKQGLSKLEKQEREEQLAKSYKERFQLPVAIALMALITDMALMMVNRYEKI